MIAPHLYPGTGRAEGSAAIVGQRAVLSHGFSHAVVHRLTFDSARSAK